MRIVFSHMRKQVNRRVRQFSRDQAAALGAKLRATAEASQVTGLALAKTLNSSQSRISRIFDGQFARESPLVEALCAYLKVNASAVAAPPRLEALPAPLRRALEAAWDGSAQGARALAALLHAATQVHSAARPAARPRRLTNRHMHGTLRR